MFRNQTMQRSVAAVVLTTFLSLSLYPLTAAAQAKEALEQAGVLPPSKNEGIIDSAKSYIAKLAGEKRNPAVSTDERFAQLLNDIHDDLKAAVPEAALSKDAKQYVKGKYVKSDIVLKTRHIRTKRSELKQLYAEIEQSFASTEQHLKNAGLPQAILDRHTEAVSQYQSRKAEFDKLMDKLEQADDAGNGAERQAALEALGGFMTQHPNGKPHQYTDPDKLPFRTPDGKVRKPHETREDYQASLFPPQYEKVLLASTSLDGVKLAQITLPQTPASQDLAETDDVQITQAIRDLANQLENNPVKIYHWVRNNIAFIPSYGSIQGSDMTLQNKRGNAFDTASLLIALYRAAGIPARYVYGTIEVPADKAMNWVGGATKPEAAQSLLGQGGIPNVALVSGGTVKAIRMEHVWVEAYVDYMPGRGAINKTANAWVPMDASFKQYQFTQGMDIKTNVPLDSQTLVDQIKQGATINEAEGWIQNPNPANLQAQLTSYQNQVKAYIDSQKANATVGDVLGTQKIIEQNHGILLGSLPYKTVAIGNKFQALPEKLKWKFKTNIYAGGWYGDSSSPYIEISQPTARLAGKKITLSFVPATQADQDLINSYLPKPHADGSPIQPRELPTSLPGYLLKMRAEFRIDGQVVAQTTDSFTMGSEVKQSNQYFNPSKAAWGGGEDNDITVGEYNAIGLDLQGIGTQQLAQTYEKQEAARNRLVQAQQDPSSAGAISGEITDELVNAGILGYFAKVDSNESFAARAAGSVVSFRLPSYGRFFSSVQASYWFGLVRNVSLPGVVLDVDYLFSHVEAKDADGAKRAGFVRQTGSGASAAEHALPELLFRNAALPANDPSQPQGLSAVKALVLATMQGQKIYTLNQSNQSLHNTLLQAIQASADVKTEIMNALAAGKEVTIHEKEIQVSGWSGSGYLILDPTTGAGAYKISGGANGGILLAAIVAILLVFVGWGVAAAGMAAIVEGIIAAASIAINSLLQKNLGMGDSAQITVSLIELLAAFTLLTVSLLIGAELLVIAAGAAMIGAIYGLIWDILV